MSHETYLGDCVYASWVDGEIKLYTENIHRTESNTIFLNAETMTALWRYAEGIRDVLYEKHTIQKAEAKGGEVCC